MIISTKFEVDMTIHCLIYYSCCMLLILYLTAWPWPLTFWPWTVFTQPLYQVWRAQVYPFLSYQSWHLP